MHSIMDVFDMQHYDVMSWDFQALDVVLSKMTSLDITLVVMHALPPMWPMPFDARVHITWLAWSEKISWVVFHPEISATLLKLLLQEVQLQIMRQLWLAWLNVSYQPWVHKKSLDTNEIDRDARWWTPHCEVACYDSYRYIGTLKTSNALAKPLLHCTYLSLTRSIYYVNAQICALTID